MTTDTKNLLSMMGATIKSLRTGKLMTQRALGYECGLEKTAVCKIESGKANPTFKTMARIAQALQVKLVALLADH